MGRMVAGRTCWGPCAHQLRELSIALSGFLFHGFHSPSTQPPNSKVTHFPKLLTHKGSGPY